LAPKPPCTLLHAYTFSPFLLDPRKPEFCFIALQCFWTFLFFGFRRFGRRFPFTLSPPPKACSSVTPPNFRRFSQGTCPRLSRDMSLHSSLPTCPQQEGSAFPPSLSYKSPLVWRYHDIRRPPFAFFTVQQVPPTLFLYFSLVPRSAV